MRIHHAPSHSIPSKLRSRKISLNFDSKETDSERSRHFPKPHQVCSPPEWQVWAEPSDQVVPKAPFATSIPVFEALSQECAANPDRPPRIELRTGGQKRGTGPLGEEWERVLSSLGLHQRRAQHIPPLTPSSNKTKEKRQAVAGGGWKCCLCC